MVHNAARDDGSCCVVVKESFGNAFVPFLAPHYENVYVIDYRYWNGDLATFVQGRRAKDVLFLNNISATRNASLVSRMQAIVAERPARSRRGRAFLRPALANLEQSG